MYNNLPELGPSQRRPPYRRAPRPIPNTMGSWFSEWLSQPFKEWKFPVAAAAVIFGGAAAGSATGLYTTTLGTGVWSGMTTVGGYFYKAPVASGVGEGTVATGILPTVFGVGVPGYGWVGSVGTGAVKLFTGSPSGSSPAKSTTTPASTIGPEPTPTTGVGAQIGTTVTDVIKNLIVGSDSSPTPSQSEAAKWLGAETIPGVTNKNLTLLGLGGGILLLFVLSGRRK